MTEPTATAGLCAHPYAHPVEKRSLHVYGPPTSEPPDVIVTKCAGRYPICDRSNHPRYGVHEVHLQLDPKLARQRRQLNALAHRQAMDRPLEDSVTAPTKSKQPGTFLSGWCNPSSPDNVHARCIGTATNGDGSTLLCRCNRAGCSCNKARLERETAGAIMCGPGEPTEGDLQAVADFAAELRERPAYNKCTAVPLPSEPKHTAWRAEEVTELMVELEACPVCTAAWDQHTFTDDDRVVCA